jgi:hypothetical protein
MENAMMDKKISDIIKELSAILEKDGDLPVEGSFEGMVASCDIYLVRARPPKPYIWDANGNPLGFRPDFPEVDTVFIGEKYE